MLSYACPCNAHPTHNANTNAHTHTNTHTLIYIECRCMCVMVGMGTGVGVCVHGGKNFNCACDSKMASVPCLIIYSELSFELSIRSIESTGTRLLNLFFYNMQEQLNIVPFVTDDNVRYLRACFFRLPFGTWNRVY